LVVNNAEADLGIIRTSTSHVFTLANRTNHVVRIVNIRTSCSCTLAEVGKRTCQPGEEGRLKVVLQPRPGEIGRYIYRIDVDVAGRATETVSMLLHAQYRPDVVSPELLTVRTTAGRRTVAQFEVLDYRDKPLDITGVESSLPNVHAVLTARPKTYLPGWRYVVELSVTPRQTGPCTYAGVVTLETTDPARPSLQVGVNVEQVQRVRVLPERLRLAPAAAGRVPKGKVYIDDREGELVEIESVTPSEECLRCGFSPKASPRHVLDFELFESVGRPAARPLRVCVSIRKPVRERLWIDVRP
jgi:hypothetical protein